MSGKKGQRNYPEAVREEVIKRLAKGESQNQISREMGIDRYVIQSWSGRRKEINLRKSNPKAKGRPRKDGQPPHQDEKRELERFRMENKLLWDFLQFPARGSKRYDRNKHDRRKSSEDTVIDLRVPEKAKLRVAAYARVSSDSEDQVNSYIAQVDFYPKHIAGKEDWKMVDIYADEGISGLEARNRDDFNRMMADCREGKIDRVLCESISRFARNTQEYIQFVRELLRLGISIHFEKENIDTGKMT